MKVIEIDKDSKYLSEIETLYLKTFPEVERVEFSDLVDKKFPNGKFHGLFENKSLVGFAYTVETKELLYLLYLAVAQDKRNNKYGSKAISQLNELYNNKAMGLSVEAIDSMDDNQKRRINFYKRNGFDLTDYQYELLGQVYYPMVKGDISQKQFMSFLDVCFPSYTDVKKRLVQYDNEKV